MILETSRDRPSSVTVSPVIRFLSRSSRPVMKLSARSGDVISRGVEEEIRLVIASVNRWPKNRRLEFDSRIAT